MTEPVIQEPERVRTGVIWRVAAAVIALCVGVTALAWWLVVPSSGARAASGSTLEHGLIEQATGGADAAAAGAHRLERYEWVDRQAGVVHIPIDRAIDAVVSDPTLIGVAGGAP